MSSRKTLLLFTGILLIAHLKCFGQFNEKLRKEIEVLSERFILNGFEKNEALSLLVSISPEIDIEKVNKNIVGKSWKYSHSVSEKARQYRLSNGQLIYNFSADGNAYHIDKKTEKKVSCTWEYESDGILMITNHESIERTKAVSNFYFGLHSISADRLVITKVIMSKEKPGKLAVLFNVYFRR